jgi:glycerate 2-kinase
LRFSSSRHHAKHIFAAALQAADAAAAVTKALARHPIRQHARILIFGAGKAAASMARAAELSLGKRVAGGLVVTRHGYGQRLQRVALREAGHPVPDQPGLLAAEEMRGMLMRCTASDGVLFLLSGGASALLPAPRGVTLEEKQHVTRLLLASGANIHEMNCVRKHLSWAKGGQLALLASPAPLHSLIVSDVIGDSLDVIGSGPTAPDPTSFADACAILRRFGLWKQIPAAARRYLNKGEGETPGPDEDLWQRVDNRVIVSNRLSLASAAKTARQLGWRPRVLTASYEGEARQLARLFAAMARDAQPGDCLLMGGESTVTLGPRHGLGGRNMEFALSAALALGESPVTMLCAGTDGADGPTDAAGAFADGRLPQRAATLGLDAESALQRHDAYPLLQATGDLLLTGPTGTNVMDICIALHGAPALQ